MLYLLVRRQWRALGWTAFWGAVLTAVALADLSPRDLPVAWLAIIAIATLRSPFLPQAYAAFPLVWLLALLAALQAPSPKQVALTAAAWLALNVFIPPDLAAPVTLALASLVPQAVTYALAALAVRYVLARRPAAAPALAPAPAVAV